LNLDITPKVLTQFWLKVEKTNNCWLWTGRQKGGQNGDRYGRFSYKPLDIYAHRFSYELFKGEIPTNLEIDHLCRVRLCVNPDHLELVSRKVNVLRGKSFSAINSRKTHCSKGHKFTPENTYQYSYQRKCKTCVKGRKMSR